MHKDREKVSILYRILKVSVCFLSLFVFLLLFSRFIVKALHHYWQAAVGGHGQAQYRHAKLLLSSRGQPSVEELNTAIGFLEQAAKAGLIEV